MTEGGSMHSIFSPHTLPCLASGPEPDIILIVCFSTDALIPSLEISDLLSGEAKQTYSGVKFVISSEFGDECTRSSAVPMTRKELIKMAEVRKCLCKRVLSLMICH
jgi:hypothetical protein